MHFTISLELILSLRFWVSFFLRSPISLSLFPSSTLKTWIASFLPKFVEYYRTQLTTKVPILSECFYSYNYKYYYL